MLELICNLLPAKILTRFNKIAINDSKNVDRYYEIIQQIANKHGNRAYELAEKVFNEMRMTYDAEQLRREWDVRRICYNFEGINIYNNYIKRFKTEMTKDVLWICNREIRKVSHDYIMDEEYFSKKIANGNKNLVEGLFISYNAAGQCTGFVHLDLVLILLLKVIS